MATTDTTSDTRLEVQSYTLNLGFRSVAVDTTRTIVPYHEIGLKSVPAGNSQQIDVRIEFYADPQQFAPTELGFHTVSQRRIVIKAPIGEFERAHNILQNEKPVFFVFNQLNPVGGNPDMKSITSAAIVTGNEPPGEGE